MRSGSPSGLTNIKNTGNTGGTRTIQIESGRAVTRRQVAHRRRAVKSLVAPRLRETLHLSQSRMILATIMLTPLWVTGMGRGSAAHLMKQTGKRNDGTIFTGNSIASLYFLSLHGRREVNVVGEPSSRASAGAGDNERPASRKGVGDMGLDPSAPAISGPLRAAAGRPAERRVSEGDAAAAPHGDETMPPPPGRSRRSHRSPSREERGGSGRPSSSQRREDEALRDRSRAAEPRRPEHDRGSRDNRSDRCAEQLRGRR